MIIPKSWLRNLVNINHVTKDSSGRTVDSTVYDVICRIQDLSMLVRDTVGDHVIYKTKIYFAPDVNIDKNCEVVVDDIIRQIDSIRISRNGSGNVHHYEVILT